MIADSAATFAVGEISSEAQRLLDVCRAALEAGIEAAQLHAVVGDISAAVQAVVEEAGFSVVRSLVGHGVGKAYHEDPQVPNFVTSYRGPELLEGMTLAIEPMITAGGPDVYLHDDEWSISTVDGSLDRALRAHRRDHRRGPAGADEGRRGPGTMTSPRRQPCVCAANGRVLCLCAHDRRSDSFVATERAIGE